MVCCHSYNQFYTLNSVKYHTKSIAIVSNTCLSGMSVLSDKYMNIMSITGHIGVRKKLYSCCACERLVIFASSSMLVLAIAWIPIITNELITV